MFKLDKDLILKLNTKNYPTKKEAEIINFVNQFGIVDRAAIVRAFYSDQSKSNAYRKIINMANMGFLKKISDVKSNHLTLGSKGKFYLDLNGQDINYSKKITNQTTMSSFLMALLINKNPSLSKNFQFKRKLNKKIFNIDIEPTLQILLPNNRFILIDLQDRPDGENISNTNKTNRFLAMSHYFIIQLTEDQEVATDLMIKAPSRTSFHLFADENLIEEICEKIRTSSTLEPLSGGAWQ